MARNLRIVLLVPLLLGLAAGCHFFRRATIRCFFKDGAPGSAPRLTAAVAPDAGLAAVSRVRVVLIDGLGLSVAQTLPALNKACSQGADLVVDNGFPTVSLPVQHVLWTGLTQTQSGVMYRIAPLAVPPAASLPVRLPDAVAVAESHNEIVRSFGFSTVVAPIAVKATTPDELQWRTSGFAEASRAAVASSARLAFIHILRVDEAGHAKGLLSDAYVQAAQQADALLGELLAADQDPLNTRWFVISDHGHRNAGGHADAEASIRLTRACVFGAGMMPSGHSSPVHLVDLHRAIADSFNLVVAPGAMGRPLAFAFLHPDIGATIPLPSRPRRVVAILCLIIGVGLTWMCARTSWVAWPWWFPVAYVSLAIIRGAVTLSNPVVYPPWGLTAVTAVVPGLVVLAAQAWFAFRRAFEARVAVGLLAMPIATCVAAAVLCGAIQAVIGFAWVPPLMPIWSAHVAVLASMCGVAFVVVALVLSVHGASRRFGHGAAAS